MRVVTVRNASKGTVLAERVEWRSSVLGRTRGLLGRAGLADGEGIVIDPCGSVHMMFMRFAIDVVYVDRQDRVVKLVRRLKPFAVSMGGRRAHRTIELKPGAIDASGTQPGDQLVYEDVQMSSAAA